MTTPFAPRSNPRSSNQRISTDDEDYLAPATQEVGDDVILNCSSNREVHLCRWKTPYLNTYIVGEGIYVETGRIAWKGTNPSYDCTIQVSHLQLRDSGTWVCEIGSSTNQNFQVQTKEFQIIIETPLKLSAPTALMQNANTDATLVCHANKPFDECLWTTPYGSTYSFKGPESNHENGRISFFGFTENDCGIIVQNVGPHDNGGWQCQLHSKAGSFFQNATDVVPLFTNRDSSSSSFPPSSTSGAQPRAIADYEYSDKHSPSSSSSLSSRFDDDEDAIDYVGGDFDRVQASEAQRNPVTVQIIQIEDTLKEVPGIVRDIKRIGNKGQVRIDKVDPTEKSTTTSDPAYADSVAGIHLLELSKIGAPPEPVTTVTANPLSVFELTTSGLGVNPAELELLSRISGTRRDARPFKIDTHEESSPRQNPSSVVPITTPRAPQTESPPLSTSTRSRTTSRFTIDTTSTPRTRLRVSSNSDDMRRKEITRIRGERRKINQDNKAELEEVEVPKEEAARQKKLEEAASQAKEERERTAAEVRRQRAEEEAKKRRLEQDQQNQQEVAKQKAREEEEKRRQEEEAAKKAQELADSRKKEEELRQKKAEEEKQRRLEVERRKQLEERRRQEEEEARTKAKALTESRRKEEELRQKKAEEEKQRSLQAERRKQLEEERKRQQEVERKKKEQEERAQRIKEENIKRLKEQQEREQKLAEERKIIEERRRIVTEQRKKEEEERAAEIEKQRLRDIQRKRQEELKRQEEEKRLAALEAQRKLEAEKQAKEEAARKAELEDKRLQDIQKKRQEELKRQEEEKRLAALEVARKLEAEKQAKEEAARKAEIEGKRLRDIQRKRQEELKRQEEEKRLAALEVARKLEAEKQAKEEAAKKAEIERTRLAEREHQLLQQRRKEEDDKKRLEEENRQKLEDERRKQAQIRRVEAERKRKESEERASRLEAHRRRDQLERRRKEESEKRLRDEEEKQRQLALEQKKQEEEELEKRKRDEEVRKSLERIREDKRREEIEARRDEERLRKVKLQEEEERKRKEDQDKAKEEIQQRQIRLQEEQELREEQERRRNEEGEVQTQQTLLQRIEQKQLERKEKEEQDRIRKNELQQKIKEEEERRRLENQRALGANINSLSNSNSNLKVQDHKDGSLRRKCEVNASPSHGNVTCESLEAEDGIFYVSDGQHCLLTCQTGFVSRSSPQSRCINGFISKLDCVRPDAMILIGGKSDIYGVLSSVELVTGRGVCRGAVPELPAMRWRAITSTLEKDKVITCGGVNLFGDPKPNCWTLAFDPDPEWSTASPMRVARDAAAWAFEEDFLFVFGGSLGKLSGYTDSVEMYSVSTGQWVEGSPMTSSRYSHCAVGLGNGSVIVTGGYGGLKLAERFDISTGQWTQLPVLNPIRAQHGCALVNYHGEEGVVVVGGDSGGTRLKDVRFLSLANPSEWKKLADLNTARWGRPAVGSIGGRITVAAGWNGSRDLDTVEYYDESELRWKLTSSRLQTERRWASSTPISLSLFPKCVQKRQ
eukprot:snap_masked-scaffold142_size315517-processed-gene-0.4 protein:Tk07693 transcript:snap_masked-scaffold142_size315517-processed-gene-0.4-mRNA-1 annotation:"hypothetical protein"